MLAPVLAFCLVLLSSVLATTSLPPTTDSMSLATQIQTEITAKKKKYLIFFGANYCPYTNEKSPTWDRVQPTIRTAIAAKSLKDVEIIRFECVDHPLCQSFGIYNIPAARFYTNGMDKPDVISLSADDETLKATLIKTLGI